MVARIVNVFAGNVRARRKDLGMTQTEVAKAADLSLVTIQQIESASVWSGLATIEALARALKIDEIKLFQDSSSVPEPSPKQILLTLVDCLNLDVPKTVIEKAKYRSADRTLSNAPDVSRIPSNILVKLNQLSKKDFRALETILDAIGR